MVLLALFNETLVPLQGPLLGDKLQKKPIILAFVSGTENCGKMITGYHGHFLTTHLHEYTPMHVNTHTHTHLSFYGCEDVPSHIAFPSQFS